MTETCMLCIQRLSSHIVTESDGSICLQTSLHAACKCLIGNWVKAPQWPVTDPSHHCTVVCVCVCVDLFLEDDSFPYYIHYICNNRLWRWKYRPWAAILLEQNYGLDVCDSLLFLILTWILQLGGLFFLQIIQKHLFVRNLTFLEKAIGSPVSSMFEANI